MRILLGRMPPDTRYRFAGDVPSTDGVPRSANTDLSAIHKNYALTMNKGNMLIGEAAARLFECDRQRSAQSDVRYIQARYKQGSDVNKLVKDNFDMVVFAMANMIRPNQDHTGLDAFLKAYDGPFIVLGAGMQVPLAGGLELLSESTASVLKQFNERALVFGVRGDETQQWLQAAGLDRAQAFGCPSLYLYPQNFTLIQPLKYSPELAIMTAGYFGKQSKRASFLGSLFAEHTNSGYVFQEEMFHPNAEHPIENGKFNDATGQVDKAYAESSLAKILGFTPNFKRYWYFQHPEAWRAAYSVYDGFVGDRFHGGIAALQCGLPAVVLYQDLRVREMTQLMDIPAVDAAKNRHLSLSQIIDEFAGKESIDRFQRTYRRRFADFKRTIERAGLRLSHSPQVLSAMEA